MNAVLLEFPDEVACFLNYCRRHDLKPGNFHVIALWPNVQVKLRRNGVSYEDTRPYFDNDSHRRIILKSEEWLQEIESSLQLVDESGIRDTYNSTFVFHVRFYINYFLWAIEILQGAIRRHSIATLTVCANEVTAPSVSVPTLGLRDRFLATIVNVYAQQHGIEFVAIPLETARDIEADGNARRSAATVLSYANWLLNRLTLARIRRGGILVNAVSYNMDRLVREIRATFPHSRFVWLQTSSVSTAGDLYQLMRHEPADYFLSVNGLQKATSNKRSTGERIGKGLEQVGDLIRQKWATAFRHENVSFVEIFAVKIRRDLFSYIRNLEAKSETIRRVLEKTRPSLVLAPFAADADALLGEWARLLRIPSLSISHGTHTPSESEADRIEKYRLGTTLILTTYGHTAVQSPWAEKYLARFTGNRAPRPLKSGNLILVRFDPAMRAQARQELLGEASRHQKLIIYATTLKPRSGLRFQIHETLDEHLEGIRHLASVISGMENAVLVVKLHPAAALKEDEVRDLVPETKSKQVRIVLRIPFEKVLSAADLLVSYSSTCIEEAIQNAVPVLLYDPWNRYQHVPAVRWKSAGERHSGPAYYLNKPELLDDALRWILNNHDPSEIPQEVWREHVFPPETRNEFLRFVTDALA